MASFDRIRTFPRVLLLLLSCACARSLAVEAPPEEPRLRRLADLRASARSPSEFSGLERSTAHPDVWWTHNDSGDEPRLFAFDSDGRELCPEGEELAEWPGYSVPGADAVDWEDLCLLEGELWIADLGNNFSTRRNLCLYALAEPDPRSPRPLQPARRLELAYPEQTRFPPARDWVYDCESLFAAGGRLHRLTKQRRFEPESGRAQLVAGTRLYRIEGDLESGPLELVQLGSHPSLPAPTAADLSPDGARLAVLVAQGGRPTPLELWLFAAPPPSARGDWLALPPRVVHLEARGLGAPGANPLAGAEALAWRDARRLRVLTEAGVWVEVGGL